MNHINYFIKDNRFYTEEAATKFLPADEAYEKGNLESRLYRSYYHEDKINWPVHKNEKERLMYEIQKYYFCVQDLGLFLDIFSNNQEALSLFHHYTVKLHELSTMYQEKYGPLEKGIMVSSKAPYDWSNNFPWGGNQ